MHMLHLEGANSCSAACICCISRARIPVRPAAGPRSTVGSASDSIARGPVVDTQSGHLFSFLRPLIQEGQLSVTGESMCT